MLGRARRKRAITIFVAVLAASLVGASAAQADFGDVVFEDCITGLDPAPPGTPCTEIANVQPSGGFPSGLRAPNDVVVTSDGTWVFATVRTDDAVAQFSRDPMTGDLVYQGCVSGLSSVVTPTDPQGCDPIPEAPTSLNGEDSGLDAPSALALSSDEQFLYVLSGNSASAVSPGDDAIGSFERQPDGDLDAGSFQCVTAETESGPSGSGACSVDAGLTATSDAIDSGFDFPVALEVVADTDPSNMIDDHIYVATQDDSSVARFNADDGTLDFIGCRSSDSNVGAVCTNDPLVTGADGANSGLDDLTSIDVSPDGTSIYTGSESDDAVAHFSRTAMGGFAFESCVTGEAESGDITGTDACVENGDATAGGSQSGLAHITDVQVSPDNAHVYATSLGDRSVVTFTRDVADGSLQYDSCLSAETQTGPDEDDVCDLTESATSQAQESGMESPRAIAMTPDGRSLYLADRSDSAVVHFARDPTTGVLDYRNCLSGETEAGSGHVDDPAEAEDCALTVVNTSDAVESGLQGLIGIASSPDGKSLYAVAELDNAIVQFGREDPPDTTIDTGPSGPTADTTPTFTFSASPSTFLSEFECSLPPQLPAFADCTSPFTANPALAEGGYTFSVRARDTFGFADPSPYESDFTVDVADPPPPPPPDDGDDGNPPPPPPPPPDDGGNGGGDGDGGDPEEDTKDPTTSIKKKPRKTVKTSKDRVQVTFRFKSNESGSEFECKLDKRAWKGCKSPKKYKVDEGKHTFKVRATDEAGNTDGSPAKFKWTVKEK